MEPHISGPPYPEHFFSAFLTSNFAIKGFLQPSVPLIPAGKIAIWDFHDPCDLGAPSTARWVNNSLRKNRQIGGANLRPFDLLKCQEKTKPCGRPWDWMCILVDIYLDLPKAAKCCPQKVSKFTNPLGFNWHPFKNAGKHT